MQINVSYDSSVANAPSGFVTAFTAAVQYFENLIQNPVTVNISVGWGEVEGISLGSNAECENLETMESGYSYSQVASALNAAGAPGAASLPVSDPTNGASFTMTSAQAKALGLIAPNAAITDGWIGFNNNANYDFDANPNDPVTAGTYDFYGIAIHEISQVLGRQITLGADGQYMPMDLGHFSAPGVRDLNNWGGYFSVDDGATNLNNFNVNADWGDPGDWVNSAANVFDTTTYPGEPMPLTAGDLTVMQSLGWSIPPQPSQPMKAYGLSGTQLFDGTAGNESITGGSSGNETVWGGAYDMIVGRAANITVGGAQSDTVIGGTGNAFLDGASGGESIVGGSAGVEMIWSGPGDTVEGGGAANETIGGVPGDAIVGGIGNEFIDGSSGNQVIIGGSAGGETIWGGGGDTVYGGGNANVTIGGGQHDTIVGGTGTELLSGWLGQQAIIGGSAGNETITGAVSDTVTGGSGGNEFIDGTAGSQQITGGTGGNETIWAGAGDTINGGGAANETIGGVAHDTITGGAGAVFIDGTQGGQSITLGSGSDTVWGGVWDTITGGSGQGNIGLNASPEFIGATTASGGAETVSGFSVAGGDQIILPGATSASINAVLTTATTANGATTITFASGSTLTLAGITHIDSSFFS
jgi:Ca2+-binding RTX toxin-like protein